MFAYLVNTMNIKDSAAFIGIRYGQLRGKIRTNQAQVVAKIDPKSGVRRYKWMSSILVPSRMRGMYLKPLEHVTSDAKVPFIRIMIALFGVAAVMIWTLSTLAQNAARSQFIE